MFNAYTYPLIFFSSHSLRVLLVVLKKSVDTAFLLIQSMHGHIKYVGSTHDSATDSKSTILAIFGTLYMLLVACSWMCYKNIINKQLNYTFSPVTHNLFIVMLCRNYGFININCICL